MWALSVQPLYDWRTGSLFHVGFRHEAVRQINFHISVRKSLWEHMVLLGKRSYFKDVLWIWPFPGHKATKEQRFMIGCQVFTTVKTSSSSNHCPTSAYAISNSESIASGKIIILRLLKSLMTKNNVHFTNSVNNQNISYMKSGISITVKETTHKYLTPPCTMWIEP